MIFSGSLVAIVTPFSSRDWIDEKALRSLIQWHIKEGTDGIVCCGTTGEAATLSDKERFRVMEICVSEGKGKIKIIAGTGTNATDHSVMLTREAKKIGVDGCLAIVPYYNLATPLGCLVHFRHIAEVGIPTIIYHHPKRTGISLPLETFLSLEKIPNIVGIKEASSNLVLIGQLCQRTKLAIFAGDDRLTLPALYLGIAGAISVIGNIFPASWKKMIHFALAKDFSRAQKIYKTLLDLLQVLSLETNPQCIKFALHLLGKCHPHLRLPLLQPMVSNQKKIYDAMKRIGFRVREIDF